MNPIKINIAPEVREFNEAVESCDACTNYAFDSKSAEALLVGVKDDGHLPIHSEWLANAIAGIAVKREDCSPFYTSEGEEINSAFHKR